MKTKEAILDSLNFGNRPVADKAMEAMDLWAKEVAIAFAEWVHSEGFFKLTSIGRDHWESDIIMGRYTGEELFNKFLTEQSTVKK